MKKLLVLGCVVLGLSQLWGQNGTITIETTGVAANLAYLPWGENSVKIDTCNKDVSGKLVIPSEIDGYPVAEIDYRAFENCENLISVVIPETIKAIDTSAFRSCGRLTEVIFPDSEFTIHDWAFLRCPIKKLTLPNDKITISHSAFLECPIEDLDVPETYYSSLAHIGVGHQIAHQKLMEAVASTVEVSSNTSRIEAIEAQLALLADALAVKDAEIEEKNERIAQLEAAGTSGILGILVRERDEQIESLDAEIATLEQRPTQEAYDAIVAERDERSTLEELQDARAGSVILAPDENGNIQLKLEIEESSDLEVWLNQGKKLEAEFQLAEGKKFMRFALAE